MKILVVAFLLCLTACVGHSQRLEPLLSIEDKLPKDFSFEHVTVVAYKHNETGWKIIPFDILYGPNLYGEDVVTVSCPNDYPDKVVWYVDGEPYQSLFFEYDEKYDSDSYGTAILYDEKNREKRLVVGKNRSSFEETIFFNLIKRN